MSDLERRNQKAYEKAMGTLSEDEQLDAAVVLQKHEQWEYENRDKFPVGRVPLSNFENQLPPEERQAYEKLMKALGDSSE
jgi:hypothetical protein